MSEPVRWNVATVGAVVGDVVTLLIDDGRGGVETLDLSPPHVQPHFLPDVGSTARLLMVGPVPFLYPDSIAQDAITAREIIAGAITAEHITATAIDGKTITGAIIQTAASGARIVIYEAPEGKHVIDTFGPTSTTPARLTVAGAAGGFSQLVLDSAPGVPGSAVLTLDPAAVAVGTGLTPTFKVGTAGVGFNNAAPIGKRTVNAAATDLPTAIALLNQIRQWGIDIGFLQ